MNRLWPYLMFLVLGLTTGLLANNEKKKDGCEGRLAGDSQEVGGLRFIPSGLDEERVSTYLDDIEAIFGEKGVAHTLGYSLPPHTLEELPSRELAMLATLARHAVRSWVDGANVISGLRRAASILEFVTPGETGCQTCRSFYNASISQEWQRSIMMHVVGHNDFAANSIHSQVRGTDPIAESLVLKKYVDQLYLTENPFEVSQFLQYLETLYSAQDFSRHTFQAPDDFDPKKVKPKDDRLDNLGGGVRNKAVKHPKVPTPNVLQAAVHNLSPYAPAWKKKVLYHYERMQRAHGYYVANKIMNEGWATLSQEIIAGHSHWTDNLHEVEFGKLLQGVAGRVNLSNPYWFGRECWRAIRRRFEERPEIRDLEPLERDQRFVAHAHELIETLDDFQFIRMALDEKWVKKHNLYLYREAEGEEIDYSVPIPDELRGQPLEQKVVLTTHWRRVVDYIANKVANHQLHFPRIVLDNFLGQGGGVIELRHEVYEGIPLKIKSAALSVYILSKIFDRPVSLKTIAREKPKSPDQPQNFLAHPFLGRMAPRRPHQESLTFKDIRIQVNPDGKLVIYETGEEGNEMVEEALTERLQSTVDAYREDLSIGFSPSEEPLTPKMEAMASKVIDLNTSGAMSVMSHVPTVGDAILEYTSMVKRRMAAMARRAAMGRAAIKVGKSMVRFRVLPLLPKFELDTSVYSKLLKGRKGAKPDIGFTTPALEHSLAPTTSDSNSDLGSGGRNPGDRFWDRTKQGGEGDGDPADELDDGDEEGEDFSDQPDRGDGNGDPVEPWEVEVPLDVFAEYLNLELPNRKKRNSGKSDTKEVAWEDAQTHPDGNLLFHEMMPNIIARGRRASDRKGLKPTRYNILREGTRYLTPADHVVSDFEVVPEPDSKAVLVQIMDMSGSMHGRPQEILKQFYYRLKILLLKKYKDLTVIHVGFNDHVAKEFEEEAFYKTFLSGGDRYVLGWNKGIEVLTRPEFNDYDKYGIMAGDFNSPPGEDVNQAMYKFNDLLNYGAVIQTILYGDYAYPEIINPVKELAEKDPFFDYGQLTDSSESLYALMTKFFSKKRRQ